MSSREETRLVMVDGRDALAYVIIRPGGEGDGNNIVVEAQAMGISKESVAYVMRELARQWDPSGEPTEPAAEDSGDSGQSATSPA